MGSSGLYYKHNTIVNDDSSIVNKYEASLTDNARVVIYNCPGRALTNEREPRSCLGRFFNYKLGRIATLGSKCMVWYF